MSATDSAVCQKSSYGRPLGRCMSNLLIWLVGFLLLSWLMSWFRWIPTSPTDLEIAEENVLSFLKKPYQTKMVNIGKGTNWDEDNYIQTLTMNTNTNNEGRTPLVLIHGFCSGVALWALNLDDFANNRAVYAFDLLGFGRSSRPTFSNDALEVENQFVQSIEAWREKMGLERFILLGHSMGGFLAASYALQHPQRVSHLILADPWGFPEKPLYLTRNNERPVWVKVVATILKPFNPLASLRAAGPLGPRLVDHIRSDLRKKFEPLILDNAVIPQYIYHCNVRKPSGEVAFKSMTTDFVWAKHPMVNRISDLRGDVPITFIHGSKSWIDREPSIAIKQTRNNSFVDMRVIQGSGHHVYADRADQFNNFVTSACDRADIVELKKTHPVLLKNTENCPASPSPTNISVSSLPHLHLIAKDNNIHKFVNQPIPNYQLDSD